MGERYRSRPGKISFNNGKTWIDLKNLNNSIDWTPFKEKNISKQFTLKIKDEYEANTIAECLMKSGYVVGVNTSTDDQVECWNIDIYEESME